MKENINILELLLYLFENNKDGTSLQLTEDGLVNELKEAGFNLEEIDRAFGWLDGLAKSSEAAEQSNRAGTDCFRVLSGDEQTKINPECWGFLLYLEQIGILDAATREIVIDRLVVFDREQIDLPQIKWVTLMVLFNHPGANDALKTMEHLVLEGNFGTVH